MREIIAAQLVRELLDYDPETGLFVWRLRDCAFFKGQSAREHSRWNSRYAATPAMNTPAKKGYLAGMIFKRSYFAHRVAWAHVHGDWPTDQIDHINMLPSDNRIANLRCATQSQNLMNRLPQRGTTEFCGITILPSGNWSASITSMRQRTHIGTFVTPEAAARAYDAAAIRLHGEFARLNFPQ